MSENAKLIFFPFYVKDWEAATARMRPLERFFYFSMLIEQYRTCKPVTESFCARLTDEVRAYYGGSTDRVQESFDFVKENHFQKVEDGYSNERAEIEIAKCYEKSNQARKNVMKRYNRSTDEVQTNYGGSTDVELTNNGRSTNQIKDTENKYIEGASASSSVADAPAPAPVADASANQNDVSAIDVSTVDSSKDLGGSSKTMLLSEAFASLPDFWRQYAEKVRPDLNPELTFTNFSFYWTQGKGAGKRRSVRGWTSTWQTWVRNEKAVSASVSAAPTNGYSKIKRSPEEEAKAIAASKAYWERYRAEQEKQKSQTADRFDQAMAFDDEKEAEKQISIALGSSGLVKVIRGKC